MSEVTNATDNVSKNNRVSRSKIGNQTRNYYIKLNTRRWIPGAHSKSTRKLGQMTQNAQHDESGEENQSFRDESTTYTD